MKRFLSIFVIAFLAVALLGCDKATTEPTTALPDAITMDTVDDFLFDANYQFVDLRNFDDQMADGWVRGFEFIPFFDYLEYSEILVRVDGWSFSEDAIKDEGAIKALFDEDKVIVLMCASGTRAGFVKDALDSLGYEHVFNAGGLGTYDGDNLVFGDGKYDIVMQDPAMTSPLPDEILLSDELIDVYVARQDVQFVDLRNMADLLTDGWHKSSTVIPFFEFLEAQEILVRTDGDFTFAPEDIKDEEALRALFCEDLNIILFCKSGGRAGYVKAALEHLGYENVYNAGGFSSYAGATGGDTGGGCE